MDKVRQVPETIPPPPIGAITASNLPTCSNNSSEQVACPEITRWSLYGCTKSAPDCATTFEIVSSRDEVLGSHSTILPPYPYTAAFFASRAVCGMTTVTGIPRRPAA